jgi:hypothetical protein
MSRFPFLASSVLIAAVLLAGCAQSPASTSGGGKAGSTASIPPTFAPKAKVDDASGSITGLVIDEESAPIVGATATIPAANLTVLTDPDGRFTLNGLVPQTYAMFVHRLGYEDGRKDVEVRAGNVTNAIITLKAVPVDESYTLTIPRVFHITADHDYVHFVIIAANANQTPLYTVRCDPCWYVIHIDRNATDVLSEAKWNTGPGPVNTQAYNDFYKGWTDNSYGTRACFVTLVNGGGSNWTADCLKAIHPETKLKVFINGGFTTVSIDQRIQTWTTFAYMGKLKQNFTALPPA